MKYTLIIGLIIPFLIGSCEAGYSPTNKSILVVEGWIENDCPPVVILTRSLSLSEDYQSIDDLNDYIVKWAKVSVSDGQDTVVLTGKYDPDFFPPYIYTTGEMIGKTGSIYTLIIEHDDYTATAVTSIPPPARVVGHEIASCEEDDSLYYIRIFMEDLSDENNFYQSFIAKGGSSKQYLASYLGNFSDDVINYKEGIPIYQSKSVFEKDFSPYFNENDSVSIKIAHISRDTYLYWSEYLENTSLSQNMFFATVTRIPSNISGGMGYWYGMGTAKKNVIVRSSNTN